MFKKHEERFGWARDQMIEANVPPKIRASVEKLLAVWWDSSNEELVNDTIAIEVFGELALSRSLTVPDEEGAVYEDARPGNIYMRDTVRVKRDAYSGLAGEAHNGRRGVVIGIRHGDIVMKYLDGRQPAIDSAHHSPHSLQKRTA